MKSEIHELLNSSIITAGKPKMHGLKSTSLKIVLILIHIFWLSAAFAQHDMNNMPNMNMSKSKPVKKPATKNKLPNTKQKPKTAGKDSVKQDMQMDMKMDMPMSNDKMQDSSNDETIADEMIPEKVNFLPGKTVRYDLYVKDTMVSFTGKERHAYAINGSIPAPTLTFTEGDTAEIYLHNELKKEETSLHWHGVILPNEADGVPYLTTAPIPAGASDCFP